MKRLVSLFLLIGFVAGPFAVKGEDAPAKAGDVKPLVVCAVPDSMPRTDKTRDGKGQGMDIALAELLARNLGRKLEVHWCANHSCSWNCLKENRCDVILGQAFDPDRSKEVAWSVPYGGAQFGLVVRKGSKSFRSLGDLKGKRIGIVAGSVGLSAQDHEISPVKSREQALNSFATLKLDAAFIDLDFAAWYLQANPKLGLETVNDYVPREHWNMALAVRAKDVQLLTDLNRELSQLAESGELKKICTSHGVPYRPPFTATSPRAAILPAWKRIKEKGELVVSMDPDNMPYSSKKADPPGFDVELSRELARELGVKLKIDWLAVERDTAMGRLIGGDCDLVMGAAIEPNAVVDDDEIAEKVVWSQPYYGTGYLLILRKDGPRAGSLADLKGEKSRKLGTDAGSIADYRLRQRGYVRRLYRNQAAVLKVLNDKDIDYAYVWANAAWVIQTSPDLKLEIASKYVPEDHWNIAAAVRKGDDELKKHVDAAIERLHKEGKVKEALARYHVPYYPPFAEKKDDKGDKEESKAPPDRKGKKTESKLERVEPIMDKIQKSKAYGGLERIRSAGVLVVGLDQNNLPFSAAHPEPAGLDYEIARLLAQKLGVSLRVYWAYSAHDSYPSKLATKNLCDVILGVMPDDRFGQRVLWTKPYYHAKYQMVVRTGAGEPTRLEDLGKQPLAIERGLAVRGLGDQPTNPYAKLEAILEAVATSKEKAGYVISTRGGWLAEKNWPGKLKLVDFPGSADAFPICAAVRKSDEDLKTALDKVFAELEESSELAKILARWHMACAK